MFFHAALGSLNRLILCNIMLQKGRMDRDQIHIRVAEIADVPIITTLSGQLGYESSDLQTEKRLKTLIKAKENAVFVATQSTSEVIGWIHVFITHRVESDSFGEIGGLVVSKNFRGQGIGKKLLFAAQEWLRQNEIGKIRVRSRTERKKGHKFYFKMGFLKEKEQVVFGKDIQ